MRKNLQNPEWCVKLPDSRTFICSYKGKQQILIFKKLETISEATLHETEKMVENVS